MWNSYSYIHQPFNNFNKVFSQFPLCTGGNLLHFDMVWTELHINMSLQGSKCYIPLQWACCLLVATAMISVMENHGFLWWICSLCLKRTLKIFFNLLITGRSFGNLFYLWGCSLSQRSRFWRIRSSLSRVTESDIACTKVSEASLMA